MRVQQHYDTLTSAYICVTLPYLNQQCMATDAVSSIPVLQLVRLSCVFKVHNYTMCKWEFSNVQALWAKTLSVHPNIESITVLCDHALHYVSCTQRHNMMQVSVL